MKKKAPQIFRRRITVSGRVQGVGYRYFCLQSAQDFGVKGWVRNRPDGAVELEAEGAGPVLDEFRGRLAGGHPWARVDGLDEIPISPLNDPQEEFQIVS